MVKCERHLGILLHVSGLMFGVCFNGRCIYPAGFGNVNAPNVLAIQGHSTELDIVRWKLLSSTRFILLLFRGSARSTLVHAVYKHCVLHYEPTASPSRLTLGVGSVLMLHMDLYLADGSTFTCSALAVHISSMKHAPDKTADLTKSYHTKLENTCSLGHLSSSINPRSSIRCCSISARSCGPQPCRNQKWLPMMERNTQ